MPKPGLSTRKYWCRAGSVLFGWKGGRYQLRQLPASLGLPIGVLVQANYGGVLMVDGIPVGEALGQYFMSDMADDRQADGSVIVVIRRRPLSDQSNPCCISSHASTWPHGITCHQWGDYSIAFSQQNRFVEGYLIFRSTD